MELVSQLVAAPCSNTPPGLLPSDWQSGYFSSSVAEWCVCDRLLSVVAVGPREFLPQFDSLSTANDLACLP
jgi:hypothetical protein